MFICTFSSYVETFFFGFAAGFVAFIMIAIVATSSDKRKD